MVKVAKKVTASIYDDMVGIMMKSASDTGMIISPYSQHSKTVKVVPVPSLALQWLINSNGWPLGRITSCAGAPKSYKSTFAHQLMAWFIQAGGIANLIDTENKQSGETLTAMVEASGMPPEDLAKRCMIGSAQTMEQWQAVLLNHAAMLKERYKTPVNCPVPWVNVVDSLTGANSQAGTDELVENEGGVAQSRVGQQNAKALYQFMRDGARRSLDGADATATRWPVTLHMVNHERDRGDGFKGKVRSGGVSQDFYTSLDLVFKIGGTSSYNQAAANVPGCGRTGRIISMQVRYSSMGPDGKDQSISVPVLTEYRRDPDTGMNQRFVSYDWGAADTHFIAKNCTKLSKVFPIEYKYVTGRGEHMSSPVLGVTELMPASEFGYLLQENKDVMQLLRNELSIETRDTFVYEPGVVGMKPKPSAPCEGPDMPVDPDESSEETQDVTGEDD